MNQDEVFAMAKAAGMDEMGGVRDNGESSIYFEGWPEQLAVFAALVAAKEREAIAAHYAAQPHVEFFGSELADEIRARGQKEGA